MGKHYFLKTFIFCVMEVGVILAIIPKAGSNFTLRKHIVVSILERRQIKKYNCHSFASHSHQ